MSKLNATFLLATFAVCGFTSVARANSADHAANLAQGIMNAKGTIDRVISASGGGSNDGGGQDPSFPQDGGVGGNLPDVHSPWLVYTDEDILEADQLAIPIMLQASSSLGNAGSMADQAKLAFLSGNTQLGNYRFAQACNTMGIARSQIARANTAALQPPTGYVAAFGNDLKATVVELNALRASEGCP